MPAGPPWYNGPPMPPAAPFPPGYGAPPPTAPWPSPAPSNRVEWDGATAQSTEPWYALGMDQDEYDHIAAVFLEFDADDSGFLDRGEVLRMARVLNMIRSPADEQALLAELNPGGRGVSREQLTYWMSQHRLDPTTTYGLSRQDYHSTLFAFNEFDRNRDGRLSVDEFERLAMRLGFASSGQAARQLFQSVDADHNGSVSLHEFLSFRASTARRR